MLTTVGIVAAIAIPTNRGGTPDGMKRCLHIKLAGCLTRLGQVE